jgi:hypothetical protein
MVTTSSIKVVINNRNRLTTTKFMVEKLLSLNPDEQIIIIDNGSTYEPLLNWYDEIKNKVDVRLGTNEGHLALWATKLYKELESYFVYTDSDIILSDDFPMDWKEIMLDTFKKYPEYNKVALAIHTDDLPDHYRYKNQVVRNEGAWWLEEVEKDLFVADTDTTFAMMKNFGDNCYRSLRLARPDLICRHHGWYLNLDELDEEETYYLENLGERVTTQYSKQHKEPLKYTDI